MSKEQKHIEALRPSEFARKVGVTPARVTHLKDKLDKKIFGGSWLVVVNEKNLSLFENAHPFRGKKGGEL